MTGIKFASAQHQFYLADKMQECFFQLLTFSVTKFTGDIGPVNPGVVQSVCLPVPILAPKFGVKLPLIPTVAKSVGGIFSLLRQPAAFGKLRTHCHASDYAVISTQFLPATAPLPVWR